MKPNTLLEFPHDLDCLARYSKLSLHCGKATIDGFGDPFDPGSVMVQQILSALGKKPKDVQSDALTARFLVPAAGNCVILLEGDGAKPLAPNFGEGLTVSGDSPEGSFIFRCPRFYVNFRSNNESETPWALASPVNEPAIISYGEQRPVRQVVATINNFDFESGDLRDVKDTVLRVEATGRLVDFKWRKRRDTFRALVDGGLLRTTSFTTFSFNAGKDEKEEDLIRLADDISTICQYVVAQQTGIPVLSLLDAQGNVIKRILRNPVESEFREGSAFLAMGLDDGLPRFFRECFAEHQRLQQSSMWPRLPQFYASIEDSNYLEQKYATLMAAVELLIRSTLIENGHISSPAAEAKLLPQLIGMARGTLRWDVPKHYTEDERYREIRNAVAHGGSLPFDGAQVRADFDKWKLFLLRRILIRLGFTGSIACPQDGWQSMSPVHEFSEKLNSYER